jgi:hypothetical protein
MARARRHYAGLTLTLCAALSSTACSESMDGDTATESNVRTALPGAAAGAAGTAGAEGSVVAAGTVGGGSVTTPPSTPPETTPPETAPPAQSFPGESCDGCVRFFLPMTGENQRGDFELPLGAPVDMTGATLRFRLMAFTGNAGGVSVYVRDAGNFDKGFVWTNLSALATWSEVAVDFTTMLAGNPSFDVTRVAKVGVQLNSAGAFAGANWQDATVYLDSVRFSNAPSADLTFSDGIGTFSLVTAEAPAGTNVGFISP